MPDHSCRTRDTNVVAPAGGDKGIRMTKTLREKIEHTIAAINSAKAAPWLSAGMMSQHLLMHKLSRMFHT